jgi:hypothetical protein
MRAKEKYISLIGWPIALVSVEDPTLMAIVCPPIGKFHASVEEADDKVLDAAPLTAFRIEKKIENGKTVSN